MAFVILAALMFALVGLATVLALAAAVAVPLAAGSLTVLVGLALTEDVGK